MKFKPDTKNRKGFTLLELMVVIAIIGILATIAVTNFLLYRQRSFDAAAESDIKNIYIAAQAYFIDFETASIPDSDRLKGIYGFNDSPEVSLNIVDGNMATFQANSFHPLGAKTYTINAEGHISYTE
jgi:type IV pilus assembly protein PilA